MRAGTLALTRAIPASTKAGPPTMNATTPMCRTSSASAISRVILSPAACAGSGGTQSSLAPDNLTILAQRVRSALICAANASGEFPTGSITSLARRS